MAREIVLNKEGKSFCRRLVIKGLKEDRKTMEKVLKELGFSPEYVVREEESWQTALKNPYFRLVMENTEDKPLTSKELSEIAKTSREKYGFQEEISSQRISSNLRALVEEGLVEVDKGRKPYAYQYKKF